MLPLSANPDYKTTTDFSLTNEYYDWDLTLTDKELFGADALNQAIEMVIMTEPQERIFNLGFGSPLYSLLFENSKTVNSMMGTVFDIIELWVPIKIDRTNTDIQVDTDNHAISFQIPYRSNNGIITGFFSRRISA